ncbi:MAG TPA: FG-GAP-like repeat-containing protein [Candidatus Polarisedimenticolaceae bacterium]|nr:FG-GAP-like repeat-containing protein [Candidatus Polarisedimenticolaceae bacterium]
MRSITFAAVALSSILPALSAAPPPSSWIDEAEMRLQQREYEITSVQGTWQAPNHAQGFRTSFDETGIHLVPRDESASRWEMGLTLAATGRPSSLAAPATATSQVDGARMIYVRGEIHEWYVNDPDGLEQGFTIAAPPEGTRGTFVIDLALSGTLEPLKSRGDGAIALGVPGGEALLHYTDLKVTDARGNELPAHLGPYSHTGHLGIRLSFDDTGATYPVTVDPRIKFVSNATWQQGSGQSASWFGYSVSTAGDVNGDGYSDVIIGAPLYDNGQDGEGRAYLYLGGPNGLATTPAWTAESDQIQANFGWVVAAAGDVNGDGYADVIVSSPGWNNGSGKVWVYYGQPGGLPAVASWTKEGAQLFGAFGNSAATAGDVNGDGYADVIIGAPSEANGQSLEGRAYVFLGSASGLAANAAWTAESNQANADFGVSVATAGDVNGDGYDDVIIGADQYDNPELNEGRAFVYLGGPGGLAASAVWTGESNQAGAQYGASVATAGDVNGDGYADIIVGAPWYDDPSDAEGRVYVYYGGPGGPATTAAWTKELDVAGAHFGASVATAGDVNGDGYADVIIGAPQHATNAGRVVCFVGGPSGLATDPWYDRQGGIAGVLMGISVGTAGDVDGDGFSDLIYGEEDPSSNGSAVVDRVSADPPNNAPQWTGEGSQASAGYGVTVASAGDVNGDGYSDVLVGSYLYSNGQGQEGKAYLYMGGPSGVSTIAAWSVESNVTAAQLGIALAGAGDVNGDGYADVIIAAPGSPTNTVAVYYGSASGLPLTPSWSLNGPTSSGISVASAGDVNGDGYSDILVGWPYNSQAGTFNGRVDLYLGSASGLSATPAWTRFGNTAGMEFGYSVASAGDVNGDGFSDVIIGAPTFSNGQSNEGEAFVFTGSAVVGTPLNLLWSQESNIAGAQYGSSVASGGDINGDGYSDVLVGQPCNNPSPGPGPIWFGGPAGMTLDTAYTNVLCQVASAADIDQDGYGDVLTMTGMLFGAADGVLRSSGWAPTIGFHVANVGQPIASAGDVNGDGFPDIVVGYNTQTVDQSNQGTASVYLGGGPASNGTTKRRLPRQLESNLTTPISLFGKSDSQTGFHLAALGGTAAGRSRVRLVWDVKPSGTPYNGSGLGSTPVTDTGAPGSAGSLASFNVLASGLGHGSTYHWRVRTTSANPFFPRTPWITAVGNTSTEAKLRMSGCIDSDGDGYGAASDPSCTFAQADCDDQNGNVWAAPGETSNLMFSGKTTLVWSAPASPGGSPTGLSYDLLRSGLAADFSTGCIVSGVQSPSATDTFVPPLSSPVSYYLSRARNACPNGIGSGTLGTMSDGTPRMGSTCP